MCMSYMCISYFKSMFVLATATDSLELSFMKRGITTNR